MQVVNLFVVRHGETMHNVSPQIFQGHLDTVLSENGLMQIQKLCERLRLSITASNRHFDKICCSDLTRAKQTINPLISAGDPPFEVIYDNRLREQDAGALTGVPVKDAYKMLEPGESIKTLIARTGENDSQVRHRLINWLESVFTDIYQPNQLLPYNTLAITHGGVIRVLHSLILPNRKFSAAKNTGIYQFTFTLFNQSANLDISKLRKTVVVPIYNCTRHLEYLTVPQINADPHGYFLLLNQAGEGQLEVTSNEEEEAKVYV